MTRLPFLVLLAVSSLCAHAKPRIAATTTFVGETVAAIAGDAFELAVIFPRDADPHAYEPSPRELAKLDGIKVIFENGLGLEAAIQGPLKNLNADAVEVSRGIVPRKLEGHEGHDHGDEDPHVWLDPLALVTWTTNIESALVKLDPANEKLFHERAEKLRAEFRELDIWIRAQVATVPEARRIIVTDHDELGYFAARYGFTIVGTVLPGFSTMAEPSARELGALEKTIRAAKVPAIFSSGSVAPALAKRVAADTGTKLVELPGCSLGKTGSETATHSGYLRELTKRIVEGLK